MLLDRHESCQGSNYYWNGVFRDSSVTQIPCDTVKSRKPTINANDIPLLLQICRYHSPHWSHLTHICLPHLRPASCIPPRFSRAQSPAKSTKQLAQHVPATGETPTLHQPPHVPYISLRGAPSHVYLRFEMNNFSSFLDAPGANMPRQAPSPSPSAAAAAAAHQNGMGGAQTNGIPMVNGLPSGGQQTDMNHLWSVVQQLSQLLEENRAQTLGIVNGVQAIQARAAEEGGIGSMSLREVNGELNGMRTFSFPQTWEQRIR